MKIIISYGITQQVLTIVSIQMEAKYENWLSSISDAMCCIVFTAVSGKILHYLLKNR